MAYYGAGMKLVQRSPGVSLAGCIFLAVVSLNLAKKFQWPTWKGLLLYGILAITLDYSIELSKRNRVTRYKFSSLLMIFGLPACAVFLILQDPLFRWVFLIPVALGLGFAALLHRRTGVA
jgi:hypothetical protein